ncbi:MAG TPA: sugar ABC transporter substrate-binding protein, partial [Candidatus Limnocylindria bacterium]|nr:sugar ABC transporter substrate-binding protein [Candidatus Limnocylindria bacterium]
MTPEPTATPAPTPISTFDPGVARDQPGPNGGTVVRWFIGLGAGTQPSQIDAEKAYVEAYNASQSDVFLQIEIIPNTTAADV